MNVRKKSITGKADDRGRFDLEVMACERVRILPDDLDVKLPRARVSWKIGDAIVSRKRELTWTFDGPGAYRLALEWRGEGKSRANRRDLTVFAGIDQNNLAARLRECDGLLVLAFSIRHHLLFVPLDAAANPPADDDGTATANTDQEERSFLQYLEAQTCELVERLEQDPYVNPSSVGEGVYAVFPGTVFYLGITPAIRRALGELKRAILHDMDHPDQALPEELMAELMELVNTFDMGGFVAALRPAFEGPVLYPARRRDTALWSWLRSIQRHWKNTHDYFRRIGFNSRRSRTSMLMTYNTRDGTFGNRFANRSAALSRSATSVIDTPRGRRGGRGGRGRRGSGGAPRRRVTRSEMISNDCANEWKTRMNSMPGSVENYHLSHFSRDTVRFSDGRGNHVTHKDGTWYERVGDQVRFTEELDGETVQWTATKESEEDGGGWWWESSDGEKSWYSDTAPDGSEDSGGGTAGGVDDGAEDPDETEGIKPNPRQPSVPDRPVEIGREEEILIALARGAGRIYPAERGNRRPRKPELHGFIADMVYLYEIDPSDAPRINPGRTGRPRRGRRPLGGRPRRVQPDYGDPTRGGSGDPRVGEALRARAKQRRMQGSDVVVMDAEFEDFLNNLCAPPADEKKPKRVSKKDRTSRKHRPEHG